LPDYSQREHSSIILVFLFLGKYNSHVLMSTLSATLFLGGYSMPEIVNDAVISVQTFLLAFKTCIFCFLFVWLRAKLPRLQYDQLMQLGWLGLLPVAVALIIIVP